ncbi:Uncharacterised protein, partial [Metamycoplasma alkalescens]
MFFQIIVQLIFIEYNGRGSNPIVNFINQKISFYNPIGQTNYYWDPFGFDTRVLTKLQNEDPNNISNILNVAMGNEVEGLSQSGKEIAIYLQNQFGGNDLKNIVDNIGDIQQSVGIKNINLNNLIPQILNGKNQTKIYGIYDGQNW